MGLEIKEILKIAEARLTEAGCDEARLDAEALLCFLLRLDRGELFMRWSDSMGDKGCEAYFGLVDVRAGRKPLHYITGEREFMGVKLAVDGRVLIPRRETETLAEAAIGHMEAGRQPVGGWRVLDLCTGSGALAISVCAANAAARMTATDISGDALDLARANAASARLQSRIRFVRSDMFDGLRSGFGGARFDLIMSNPPYVRSGDLPGLQPEISMHEPALALDGGADGLDAYRKIAGRAHAYLRKRGRLFLEIGHDQAEAVMELLRGEGKYGAPTVIKDLGGNDRVISAGFDE
jgi:release factor glutamine methyltransferase